MSTLKKEVKALSDRLSRIEGQIASSRVPLVDIVHALRALVAEVARIAANLPSGPWWRGVSVFEPVKGHNMAEPVSYDARVVTGSTATVSAHVCPNCGEAQYINFNEETRCPFCLWWLRKGNTAIRAARNKEDLS